MDLTSLRTNTRFKVNSAKEKLEKPTELAGFSS